MSEPARPAGSPPMPWRALIAVIAAMAIYAITIGVLTPLLSLIMERRGDPGWLIGAMAAMPAIAMLLVPGPLAHSAARVGLKRFLIACIVVELALVIALKLWQDPWAWLAIRFVMGVSMTGLFVVSETWINQIVDSDRRGRVVAGYSTAMAAGFALGPVIIAAVGIEGWPPFLLTAAAIAVAAIPIATMRDVAPVLQGRASFRLIGFLAIAPTLAAAALLIAFVESAVIGLLPVWALRSGLDTTAAALMLTVIGIGGVFCQVPIGWLADRLPRRRIMLACASFGIVCTAALPFVAERPLLLWPLMFLWGGIFPGVYLIALVLIGDRFRGTDLITANAAIAALWGFGSLIGPGLSGPALDLWDPHGLPAVLTVATLAFVALAAARSHRAGSNS